MATGADWRVGDAEREAVAEQLRERLRRRAAHHRRVPGQAGRGLLGGHGGRSLSRVTADLPAAAAQPQPAAARRATGAARPSATAPWPGPAAPPVVGSPPCWSSPTW